MAQNPDQGKRTAEVVALARAAHVSPNGGIDEHVAGLTRIGLLVRDGRGFRLADPLPSFASSLGELLDELQRVRD